MMKNLILIILLLATLVNSGCFGLGLAAIVRWDQRRWKAMQEKENSNSITEKDTQ